MLQFARLLKVIFDLYDNSDVDFMFALPVYVCVARAGICIIKFIRTLPNFTVIFFICSANINKFHYIVD